MNQDRPLRILHTAVTAQFTASAAFIIVWTLYAAGLNWWAVFSLSAQAFVIVVLGVLIYGFAIFRGAAGERIEAEHPLSGSIYYRLFYVIVPILGGIAAGIEYFADEGLVEGIRGFALGTVLSAYVVWLFVDAAVAIAESALPESRALRALRLARQRERREAARRQKEALIAAFRAEWSAARENLRPLLHRRAEELVALLAASAGNPSYGAGPAASIGLEMWQAGQMKCMKELFAEVERACSARSETHLLAMLDYWWDGIGAWRRRAWAQPPEANG
jgi:hypothetical protein